jgi:hypothetical protein
LALEPGEHTIEGFSVLALEILHKGGRTFGYRVADGQATVAYLSDHCPTVFGGALGAGAVVALGLTLIASVRRRRRELAVLKTLGFTGRQLASVVAWQSSVAVGIGVVVGVPLGIIVGRILWDLFATEIHAVPAPSVPALSVVLICVGALVLANIVAAIPGRVTERTSTALLLSAE